MGGFWYRALTRSADLLGSWVFALISRCIALAYFLFSGKVKESCRFYKVLFPQKSPLYHRWCTFKQYQNFTTIHFDRFMTGRTGATSFSTSGWEKLEAVIGNQGGILLMSHVGNWEMAATLLKKQRNDLQLLLYMGVKEKEGVERLQKEQLRESGVTIIGADRENDNPFSAVEGIRFLQNGGLVSMTGDVIWRDDQRKVPVEFLGRRAYVSEAPFIFALVSGAPLFAFFAFRGRPNTYRLTLSDPIPVRSVNRQQRQEMIRQAAQQYAFLLEDALQHHPFEWYHFNRFIH